MLLGKLILNKTYQISSEIKNDIDFYFNHVIDQLKALNVKIMSVSKHPDCYAFTLTNVDSSTINKVFGKQFFKDFKIQNIENETQKPDGDIVIRKIDSFSKLPPTKNLKKKVSSDEKSADVYTVTIKINEQQKNYIQNRIYNSVAESIYGRTSKPIFFKHDKNLIFSYNPIDLNKIVTNDEFSLVNLNNKGETVVKDEKGKEYKADTIITHTSLTPIFTKIIAQDSGKDSVLVGSINPSLLEDLKSFAKRTSSGKVDFGWVLNGKLIHIFSISSTELERDLVITTDKNLVDDMILRLTYPLQNITIKEVKDNHIKSTFLELMALLVLLVIGLYLVIAEKKRRLLILMLAGLLWPYQALTLLLVETIICDRNSYLRLILPFLLAPIFTKLLGNSIEASLFGYNMVFLNILWIIFKVILNTFYKPCGSETCKNSYCDKNSCC